MRKERRITAPEGCEIEKVELVDGVAVVTFREKERKLPKSWEEYFEISGVKIPYNLEQRILDVTKDLATAEAVLALMQLIQLRNCYNGDWVPDWFNYYQTKYVINLVEKDIVMGERTTVGEILYFKNRELRDEFLRCFKPLIEKLKPLYGIKEGGEE